MKGMKETKHRSSQFHLQGVHVFALVLLALALALFIHSVGSHYQPWTSVVPDRDHDGQLDVAYHTTVDQCVSYIHSLGVSGQCRLRCDHLGHCVQTLDVTDTLSNNLRPSMSGL
jgi:hypothetical protein